MNWVHFVCQQMNVLDVIHPIHSSAVRMLDLRSTGRGWNLMECNDKKSLNIARFIYSKPVHYFTEHTA